MPFYEVIFETGNRSVIEAMDDQEAMIGIQDHQDRAIAGESGRGESTPRTDLEAGLPQVYDYPAERIARVLKYEVHPGDYNADATMSSDVVKTEVDGFTKDKDVVNLMELSGFARDLADPMVDTTELSNTDSQYKMQEDSELTLPWTESEGK